MNVGFYIVLACAATDASASYVADTDAVVVMDGQETMVTVTSHSSDNFTLVTPYKEGEEEWASDHTLPRPAVAHHLSDLLDPPAMRRRRPARWNNRPP